MKLLRRRRRYKVDVPEMGVRGAPGMRKEDAPCCNARRDEMNRLPVGWCSPDCLRRPNG